MNSLSCATWVIRGKCEMLSHLMVQENTLYGLTLSVLVNSNDDFGAQEKATDSASISDF